MPFDELVRYGVTSGLFQQLRGSQIYGLKGFGQFRRGTAKMFKMGPNGRTARRRLIIRLFNRVYRERCLGIIPYPYHSPFV
jgi:hypothetical protein